MRLRKPAISLLAASLASVVTSGSQRSSPGNQENDPVKTFRHWLDLARQHVPGEHDLPVTEVRSYSIARLSELFDELKGFNEFLKDSSLTRLRGRTRFSVVEQFAFAKMASDEVTAGTSNRLLRRIAMLHTDAAALPGANTYVIGDSSLTPNVTVANDGVPVGHAFMPPYWPIARLALEGLQPEPGRDTWARMWYRATTAYMLFDTQLAALPAHLKDWRTAIPSDGASSFAEGCFYEALASDRIQQAAQSERSRGGSVGVPELRPALERARTLFGQVRPDDEDYPEARVRLARVLWRLGQARLAVDELTSWLAIRGRDRDVQYFAYLFLGAAQWTLGNADDAARAYEEAMRLYPAAQSPVVALLFVKPGGYFDNDAPALRLLHADPADRDDPWLEYEIGTGRHVMPLIQGIWRSPDLR